MNPSTLPLRRRTDFAGNLCYLEESGPYASFVNFDGPDRSACHPKRSRTNTPLQALTLLNDQAYVEMPGFAVSILKKHTGSPIRNASPTPSVVPCPVIHRIGNRCTARPIK